MGVFKTLFIWLTYTTVVGATSLNLIDLLSCPHSFPFPFLVDGCRVSHNGKVILILGYEIIYVTPLHVKLCNQIVNISLVPPLHKYLGLGQYHSPNDF